MDEVVMVIGAAYAFLTILLHNNYFNFATGSYKKFWVRFLIGVIIVVIGYFIPPFISQFFGI